MPTVYIPSPMQNLCGGKQTLEVQGSTLRQVVEALEQAYPGMKERLVESGRIKPNISVAIDGEVTTLGMLERVGEDSEVHFLPAISGGSHMRVWSKNSALLQKPCGQGLMVVCSGYLDAN